MEKAISIYRDLCKNESSIPIFSRDWWLDAVCGEDNWDVVIVKKSGEVIAAMPYIYSKRMGFSYVVMPKLTQKLGPWIKYSPLVKNTSRMKFEKKVLTELINKIPSNVDFFCVNFDHSIKNCLPFYWHGFQQKTSYTYIIDDLNNLDMVYNGFDSSARKEITKAKRHVRCEISNDIELFYKINAKTFSRQDMKMPYSMNFLERLDNALTEHNARRIFLAKDNKDRIHAAIYIVWDANYAYYLMGGGDPVLRNSGATSLLMWEAIQFASTVSSGFDFEGSMIEPIERFFRSFGPVQTPYYNISKVFNRKLRILKAMQNLAKAVMKSN